MPREEAAGHATQRRFVQHSAPTREQAIQASRARSNGSAALPRYGACQTEGGGRTERHAEMRFWPFREASTSCMYIPPCSDFSTIAVTYITIGGKYEKRFLGVRNVYHMDATFRFFTARAIEGL